MAGFSPVQSPQCGPVMAMIDGVRWSRRVAAAAMAAWAMVAKSTDASMRVRTLTTPGFDQSGRIVVTT